MVTEPGGTIAEHRRILRHYGRTWWGWWFRQSESVPRSTVAALFENTSRVPILLLDSGSLTVYRAQASEIVIAPTAAGVHSPDYDLTPEYYVRAQYPLWFMLTEDILPIDTRELEVVARPTAREEEDNLPNPSEVQGITTSVEDLRADGPTLWLVRNPTEQAPATAS